MLDIKSWLETIGLKVAEERFLEPPPLPYIIFTSDANVRGADNKNCISNRTISIELYSVEVDHISEKLIEDLLNEKAIEYKNDRTWIDTEEFFQSVYDFNLVEKF